MIVPDAGHTYDEPGILAALLEATDRSGDLWDALLGAILRCTMQLEHVRVLYRDTAKGLGKGYDAPAGRARLFPSPTMVLQLSADVFEVYGLSHVRDHLRTAAWVARELESRWRTVP
ncbi:hypothetical protein [Amycolatopsis sp. cmx-11-12]|uniref:hypothetical protein n=1 Tax=Amycolatopsis sp. cmx-11-12 TaxID=2785795 RepID=UPI0039184071